MIADRARSLILRWRFLVRITPFAIPVIGSSTLGFVWLYEQAYLLEFFLACLAIVLVTQLILKLPAKLRKKPETGALNPNEGPRVATDPDWSPAERRAFAAGQALIDERLKSPLETEEMQDFALQVLTAVAEASGERGREPLDFTVPEALLLVERVASHLRGDFKSYFPIADRISVKTLFWIWTNQERVRKIYGMGHGIYRISRFTTGFHVAITREILDLVTSGNKQVLTSEAQIIGQRILFEEIAKASTELYSGRLKMSDAELLDSILADSALDRQRLAQPDAPLRIAIAGQVSSGKSSLVNALLGHHVAETDMPPTTDRPAAYDGEIDGAPCRVIDLPGLDGSSAATEQTLHEAQQCDILLWAVPANRPGREIDRASITRIRDNITSNHSRRLPPILGVATFCDTLAGSEWPYPEHDLPIEVQDKIGDAVRTIADETGLTAPVPVALGPHPWNTDALADEVSQNIFEGINVQRNRVRLASGDKSITREAVDTVQGLTRGLRDIGKHAAARYWSKN
jgi:uncharacterized protein